MSKSFDINIITLDRPETLLCMLTGSLELSSTMELENILKKLIVTNREKIIFDLGQVSYINSQGFSSFLAVQKKLSAGKGGVVLVAANKRLRYILDLTGFYQAIPVYDNLEEALQKDVLFQA